MTQRGTRLVCEACGWPYVVQEPGEVSPCEKCGGAVWRTQNDPTKEYALSENDRRFLRGIRIQPEV